MSTFDAAVQPRLPLNIFSNLEFEIWNMKSIGSQGRLRHSPFKRGTRGFESHPIDHFCGVA